MTVYHLYLAAIVTLITAASFDYFRNSHKRTIPTAEVICFFLLSVMTIFDFNDLSMK